MSTGTTSTCPAVGYYGIVSAQPSTSTWVVGQSLQIVLEMCSTSPPSSNVPIDVVAWASACYQASFGNLKYLAYTCYDAFLGDLGNLAYYPANQSQAKITITIPPLAIPNMYPSGTYNGLLGLSLSVQDPRGTSGLTTEIPLTIATPGAATTTSVSTATTTIVTSTSTATPPLAAAPTPTQAAPTPPSRTLLYIAIGGAIAVTLAGLGYHLYRKSRH